MKHVLLILIIASVAAGFTYTTTPNYPVAIKGPPAAGKRVIDSIQPYFAYPNIKHCFWLPENYDSIVSTGSKLSAIIEFPGSTGNAFTLSSGSGYIDPVLGYGLSTGKNFVFCAMPFIDTAGQDTTGLLCKGTGPGCYPSPCYGVQPVHSVTYTKNVIRKLIDNYHVDSTRIIFTGISRGGAGAYWIGNHDTTISKYCCSVLDNAGDVVFGDTFFTNLQPYTSYLNRLNQKPQLMVIGLTKDDAVWLVPSMQKMDSIFSAWKWPHQLLDNHTAHYTIWSMYPPESTYTAIARQWCVDVTAHLDSMRYSPQACTTGQRIYMTAKHGLKRALWITIDGDSAEVDTIRTDTTASFYVPAGLSIGNHTWTLHMMDTSLTMTYGLVVGSGRSSIRPNKGRSGDLLTLKKLSAGFDSSDTLFLNSVSLGKCGATTDSTITDTLPSWISYSSGWYSAHTTATADSVRYRVLKPSGSIILP